MELLSVMRAKKEGSLSFLLHSTMENVNPSLINNGFEISLFEFGQL